MSESDVEAGAEITVRERGLVDYLSAYAEMRAFTARRQGRTGDEIWLLEHPAIYTVGLGGRVDRAPAQSHIPLERVDRGGQITYHGPGQIIMYVLLDLDRRGMKVRALVHTLEEAVIRLLGRYAVTASRRTGAPGVYVDGVKVAALGLRVRKGSSYHGLALNVDMDLSPFDAIDPCGYPGLRVTQTKSLGITPGPIALGRELATVFAGLLSEKAQAPASFGEALQRGTLEMNSSS